MKGKLILLVVMTLFCLSGATEKVALISLDGEGKKLEELTTVFLSQSRKKMELQERSALENLKKELRLNAEHGDDSLRPGMIENADILCVVTEALTCFDVRMGIRLWETSLSGETLAEKAFIASQMVERSIDLHRAVLSGKEQCAVSFLPLLSVNLSAGQEKTARDAVTSIRRNLLKKEGIIVLERQYLLEALKEPDQGKRGLLKNLLPSAFIVRIERRPGAKESVDFSIKLETPNGKPVSKWQGALAMGTPPPENLFAKLKPEAGAGKDESDNVFQQAQFLFSHGKIRDAVELAASGTALDSKKAANLAGMIFHAIFEGGYRLPATERGAFYVRTLSCAVPIAEKQNYFYHWAMRMIVEGHFSPDSFQSFSPEEQAALRELIGRLIRKAHEIEQKEIDRHPKDSQACLNARGSYLNFMDHLLSKLWDYTLYEQYVIPELERFIADTNARADELEKWIAQRKLPAGHDAETVNLLQRSSLGNRLSSGKGRDHEIMNKVFHLMEKSVFLHLAARGYAEEWRHNKKLQSGGTLKEALVRCFEKCRFPDENRSYLESTLWELPWNDYFELTDILIRRFGYYYFRHNGMLGDLKNVSPDKAKKLHEKLFSYYTGVMDDPRSKLPSDWRESLRSRRLNDMRMLEEKYQIPPVIPTQRFYPFPFENTILPMKKLRISGRPSNPAFDGRYFYFAVLNSGNNEMRMFKLDTQKNFKTTFGAALPSSGWCGMNMDSVIVNGFFVVLNGKYAYFFPLDGSLEGAYKVDFSAYNEEGWWNAVAADGDRLFLSCGQWAGIQKPGTVLEYHVKTKNITLIVSTLDRSVEWPMKKFQTAPYHIHQLVVDRTHRELLMLLHTNSFAYGWSAPPMMAWGYNYETGEWRSRSGRLPEYSGKNGKLHVKNGQIMLIAERFGFGPIAADGKWRPLLMLNSNNKLIATVPEKMKKNLDIDYSAPAPFKNLEFNVATSDMNSLRFGDDMLVGSNELYLIPEKIRYVFKNKTFHHPHAIFGKYLVEISAYSTAQDAFKIVPIKDCAEIIRLFEEGSR